MKYIKCVAIHRDRYRKSQIKILKASIDLNYVFSRAFAESILLTTVDFSECHLLRSLHEYAFYNCRALESIVLPRGFESIMNGCFSGCVSLRHINLEHTITTIGSYSFSGCRSLKHVVVPPLVTVLGISCFADSGIESIVIPRTLEIINYSAFAYCLKLKFIDIPEGPKLLTIEQNAFANSSVEVLNICRDALILRHGSFSSCCLLHKIICQSTRVLLSSSVFLGSQLKLAVFTGHVGFVGNPFIYCRHLLGIWIGSYSSPAAEFLQKLTMNHIQIIVIGKRILRAPQILINRLGATLPEISLRNKAICHHHFRWLPYVRHKKMLSENEQCFVFYVNIMIRRYNIPQELVMVILSFLHWSDIPVLL